MRACLFAAVLLTPFGDALAANDCDPSIRACCQGVAYWSGQDVVTGTPIAVEGRVVDPVQALVDDHNGLGGLRDAEARQLWITAGVTAGAFGLIVLLMWVGARRSALDGRALYAVLVLIPAGIWVLLPPALALGTATDRAKALVEENLKPLCFESPGAAASTATGCSPKRWANVFAPNETAQGTLAVCRSMPVETEQLLAGIAGEEPCVDVCAEAIGELATVNPAGARSEVGGFPALKTRLELLRRFMSDCDGLVDAWRAERGPPPEAWQRCTDQLADRQVRRALASDGAFVPLRFAWLGGALSFLAALLLGALVLQRR